MRALASICGGRLHPQVSRVTRDEPTAKPFYRRARAPITTRHGRVLDECVRLYTAQAVPAMTAPASEGEAAGSRAGARLDVLSLGHIERHR